jgi:hypothetical protein
MGGMSAGAGSAAMTLSLPTLAFVFSFVLVGYAVWDLDQLSGRRYSTGRYDAGLRVSLAGVGPVGVPQVAASQTGARPAAPTPDARHADQAGAAYAGGAAGAADGRGHGGTPRTGGAAAFLLSPAVTVGCRIAMGVTMAFMLLIAL